MTTAYATVADPGTSPTADRELTITRVFGAPRELVFQAFTDPATIGLWWGPNGFTNTIHEMDVRPGGVWRYMMHGPDGTDYPNKVIYREVVPGERLEYDHGGDDGVNEDIQFHVTITFADEDGGTRVNMRSLFPTVEERRAVDRFGAVEGGKQTLDRLAAHLAGR